MINNRLCISGIVLIVMSIFNGCSSEGAVTHIRLAHHHDVNHPAHKAMAYMAEQLEVISGNSMRIDIYPSGQLGTERELIELLQIGSLGMTKVSASPLEGFIPQMKVFSLPYLFRDNAHYWQVLESGIGKSLLLAGDPFMIRGLAYYDAGSRSFYSTKKPVFSPQDLEGLQIRVMNSQTAMDMVDVMGGSATPVDWGELYTALQQGVVDGAENNPPSFYLSRHYEISKFYTLDEHTSIPDILLISKTVWDSLSHQEQLWLQQAADDSVSYQRQLWKEATDDAMAAIIAGGVEVIRPDKKPFLASVQSLYEKQGDLSVAAMIRDIREMKE